MSEGLALFNAGEFWEAHEAWERIWRRHAEPWRFFIQGLIQAAAAHHQMRRGIHHGTVKHLMNALVKLEVAPPDFAGLALEEFRGYLRKLLAQVEEVEAADFGTHENLRAAPLRFLASK
ncbi:MAG: DUF309 domain-containing protein [candidate division KSB1 bacterium]